MQRLRSQTPSSVSSTPNEVWAIPCEVFGNTLRALFLKSRDFFWYYEIFLPNTRGSLGCLLGFWPSGPKPCGGNKSVTANFSRLFERVMFNVMTYSIVVNLVFRKTHSTSLASIHLISNISYALDRHEITAAVFLHLSRAFDTIDHKILFGKLEHFGVWLLLGLKVIFFVAINLFNLILHVPLNRLLNVVSYKVPF